MRYLRGLYLWPTAFLMTGFLWLRCVWARIGVLYFGKPDDGRACHRIATIWGRSMIRMMPGWKVEIEGAEHLPPDGSPMVIVANHESISDIWAMYYLGVQFRWLAKDSAFKMIFVGDAMRWSNYVPVVRGSRESHAHAMRESAARIRAGLSMFFFPEGTRSEDGRIKEFKPGAFRLAQETQVPILPIAIHGAGDLLQKHSWLPGRATVKLRVMPPVPPPSEGGSLDEYTAHVRAQIVAAHAQLI